MNVFWLLFYLLSNRLDTTYFEHCQISRCQVRFQVYSFPRTWKLIIACIFMHLYDCRSGFLLVRGTIVFAEIVLSLTCLFDVVITLQGPATLVSHQKEATSNAKPNSGTSYTMHNRQRSMKRGGGSNNIGAGPSQSNFANPPPPPPPPPFPVFQIPPSTYGNVVPGVSDPSPREVPYRSNNWDTRPSVGGFVPPVNDHRSSSRRGNFGPHPRGDGPYHSNYGGRRDQDRGNYANTRDAHGHHGHQQRMSPRGLVRHPPPNNAAFVAPQPMAPYPNPMGFPGEIICSLYKLGFHKTNQHLFLFLRFQNSTISQHYHWNPSRTCLSLPMVPLLQCSSPLQILL